MPLFDKEGNPINYLASDYNPVTQQNEAPSQIFEGLGKGIGKGTIITETLDRDKALTSITDYKPMYLSPEDYDENYDAFAPLGSWEEMHAHRIQAQSNWAKAGRATFGGLMKGIGTALKDIGYMTDWRSYAKIAGLMDMEEEGWLNETLNVIGDWLHESVDEYVPIYEDTSSKSLTNQFMKWSTVSSVLDSAVGFAIPGGVASKAGTFSMKGISAAGKIMKWTGRIRNLTGLEQKGIRLARAYEAFNNLQMRAPQTSNILNVVAPAIMQGVGEGMWEAKDSYTEHLDSMSDLILSGQIDIQEANNQANDIAQNVLRLNMAKTFLNFHIFNSVATKFGKGFIKSKPTMGVKLLSAVKEMPAEGVEEGSQEIFKKESEYRALKAYDDAHKNSPVIDEMMRQGRYSKDLSTDFYTRMTELASTNDVLLAGIIGVISGPIQHGLMRGRGAGKRFKAEIAAYEKQQAFIKDNQGLIDDRKVFTKFMKTISKDNKGKAGTPTFSSKAKSDLNNTITKVALSERVIDLANDLDNDMARDLVKKQAYTAMIQEHLAAGTYEYLEEQAAKYKGTDHHMAELSSFMEKLDPLIKKSHRYANTSAVFNKAMNIQLTKDMRDMYQKMHDESIAERTTRTKETLEEHDNLISIKNAIKKLDSNIAEVEEDLDLLTSTKMQNLLFRQTQYENEFVEVRKTMDAVTSLSRLNQLTKLYPELIGTSEYKAKAKELQSNPIKTKKKIPVTVVPKTESEVVADEEREIGQGTETTAGGLNSYDKKKKRTLNETGNKVNSNGVIIIDEDTVEARIGSKLNALSDKISNKAIKEITRKVYKKYDKKVDKVSNEATHNLLIEQLIDNAVTRYIENNREDVQEELKETTQDINRLNRKRQLEVLPEEETEKYIAFKNKVKSTKIQIDEIKKKSVHTAEENAIIQGSEKELSQVDIFEKDMVNRIIDAIKKDTIINPDSRALTELFPEFKNFLVYMTDILGEDFVSNNYIDMKYLYRIATNYKADLPSTYLDVMGDTIEQGLPGDMPTHQRNTAILKSKQSGTVDVTFDNTVKEYLEDQSKMQVSNNLDPSNSIAHLSKSFHIEYDEDGVPFIEEDTEAIIDLAVFLNPLKYNGTESITFAIDTKYKGDPKFNEIRSLVMDTNGNILPDSPEFREYVRHTNLPGDSMPEDFVPIKVIGPNGEDFKWVHLPEWAEKTHPDSIEAQRKKIKEQRSSILKQIAINDVAKGNLDGKIMYWDSKAMKYKGFVMNDGGIPVQTFEAIPEDVIIGSLGSGGNMINSKVSPKHIMNIDYINTLPPGMSFILVPITKKEGTVVYHAEPIFNNNLSKELAETATAMITVYLNKDAKNDLTDTFKTRFKGLDITTAKGLETALNNFMYIFKPKSDLDSDLRYHRNKETGKNALFSIDKKTGAIAFGIAGKQEVVPRTDQNDNTENIESALKILNSYFNTGKFLFNINQQTANRKNFPVITVDQGKTSVVIMPYNEFVKRNTKTTLVGSQLSDDSYTYTLQNIMTFKVAGEERKAKIPESEIVAQTNIVPTEKPKGEPKPEDEIRTSVDTTQEVLNALGLSNIIVGMSVGAISNITNNTNEAQIIFDLININDINGLNKNIPYMRFYKELNPIVNDARYNDLSEDDQDYAEDLYNLSSYNKDKIFNLAKRKQLETTVEHIESSLFNEIQELEKQCK